mmetsp:Transcript_35361/g.63805  ORF Transcript_35361/g.63805 Transcript_35361/m.63805 type:complete len:255 (+) Transcript_35361:752-1516(+)
MSGAPSGALSIRLLEPDRSHQQLRLRAICALGDLFSTELGMEQLQGCFLQLLLVGVRRARGVQQLLSEVPLRFLELQLLGHLLGVLLFVLPLQLPPELLELALVVLSLSSRRRNLHGSLCCLVLDLLLQLRDPINGRVLSALSLLELCQGRLVALRQLRVLRDRLLRAAHRFLVLLLDLLVLLVLLLLGHAPGQGPVARAARRVVADHAALLARQRLFIPLPPLLQRVQEVAPWRCRSGAAKLLERELHTGEAT